MRCCKVGQARLDVLSGQKARGVALLQGALAQMKKSGAAAWDVARVERLLTAAG